MTSCPSHLHFFLSTLQLLSYSVIVCDHLLIFNSDCISFCLKRLYRYGPSGGREGEEGKERRGERGREGREERKGGEKRGERKRGKEEGKGREGRSISEMKRAQTKDSVMMEKKLGNLEVE